MSLPYAEVIGDPIAHSKSPLIHNFWLKKLGIDADYRACRVRADELADYFARRHGDAEWRGCNVTMPHKQTVQSFLDAVARDASRIGAINCIYGQQGRLIGENTDAEGFLEPLKPFIRNQNYLLAYVLGSGGAARAVCDALSRESFTLFSVSRDREKARAQVGQYLIDDNFLLEFSDLQTGLDPLEPNPRSLDLLVNASPLGMTGFPPLLIDFGGWPSDLLVYDLVTSPLETDLLQKARNAGLTTIDGLAMLIGQAASSFQLFFGEPAPREHDAELRALVTA